MPHVSRDTAYLANPIKAGLLTLITVADPWLRTAVTNTAIRRKDLEPRTLPEDAGPADVTRAAATRPLIGKPLIRAVIDRRTLAPEKLIPYCTDLAAVAKNPTVLNYPMDMAKLTEYLKDAPEKAQWLIVRQSVMEKEPERKSLVEHILRKLYKPMPVELQEWYDAATKWLAEQPTEEASPTALRSTLELVQLVAADPLGRLNQDKLPEILAMDKVADRQFPDIMPNLMDLAKISHRTAQLKLLRQISLYTRTPELARMLASVIETTTIEMATSTTKIPQTEDSRTHDYKRKLIRDLGQLTDRQMIRASTRAMRLAHAIRTSAYPVSAVAEILDEIGPKT